MSEHYSEYDFEKFCLTPEELSDSEKSTMAFHLKECSFCREHFEQIQGYYRNLQETLNTSPNERDTSIARKLLARNRLFLAGRKTELNEKTDSLVESFAEVIEPYRRSLGKRIMRYIRVHPLQSAGAFALTAVALLLVVTTIRPSLDKNPAYVTIQTGSLIVHNNHGDELWRKHFGSGYDTPDANFLAHLERAVSVLDVDGDGTKEVISTFSWSRLSPPLANSLFCYQADGTERWEYGIHRAMNLGGILYSDDYRFYHLETGDFTHSGRVDVIAAARHQSWNPNFIVHLDGNDGRFLGEFLHPGELREFDHKDLDHDGNEELIYGGQNNKLEHACLVVFDPRFISGTAPAPDAYYPQGMAPGTEKFYIMFAASDMKLVRRDITNEVTGVRLTQDGMTEAIVDERGPESGTLYYYFDSLMNCVNVRAADSFTSTHVRLEREGKLTEHLTNEYFEALKRGVMYWNGDKFVNGVAMNRHYPGIVKPPPSP